MIELSANRLVSKSTGILGDVPASVSLVADPVGVGVYLAVKAEARAARHTISVGKPQFVRWTACYRNEPYWMRPSAGSDPKKIPFETQSLVVELADGRVALLIPILDGAFRCTLEANEQGELILVGESGDPAVTTDAFTGLFVAAGEDIFALCEAGAKAVAARLGSGRLRKDKPLPRFMDQFGWCTWDAFYQEVSHEKVAQGLESFQAGGVQPRMLILDDGWQQVTAKSPAVPQRLTGFAAQEPKFPEGLKGTVDLARRYGVENFLVWHTLQGYWGGADPSSFPGYGIRKILKKYSPSILHYAAKMDEWCGGPVTAVVATEHIYAFYQAYHRYLRQQGVNGVKVDNQSSSEGLAVGEGGRVRLLRKYHEALEGSIHTHFAGNLINCMSCGNDILYQTLNSTLTRTSTDFWPKRPETHGLHLYTNSQVCLWWGQFVHGDWDMFQSGHDWGSFHAAGRAVSGAPVYVSDKPGEHNFELLRKLVCADGSVLRCDQPGQPTRDCIFADVTEENVLLKIWNTNGGGASGVIGIFNCRYSPEAGKIEKIAGTVSPADVPGLAGEEFAVYLQCAGKVAKVRRGENISLALGQGEWEIATIVPLVSGAAIVGLADKLNSGGAVRALRRNAGTVACTIRDGGELLAYLPRRPQEIAMDGTTLDFTWEEGVLRARLPHAGEVQITQ